MKDPVVQTGDPVLRAQAKPVAHKDVDSPKIKKIIDRMKKTLNKEEFGVALAAPQIGESLRIFVVARRVLKKDAEDAEMPPDKVFTNPEIVRLSRAKREMSEGCLSVRGKYGTVVRHEKASIRALDEKGNPFTQNATDLLAHIFQHEVDHLDGTLYTDKAVKLEDESKRDELRANHPA